MSTDTMIPLETNRRILTWFCVYQRENVQMEERERLMHRAFALFIFAMNSIGFIVSVAYFVKFVTIDFEEALFALLQLCGEGNMMYINVITFMLRRKITDIFNAISAIYAECKYHFVSLKIRMIF